MALVVRPQYGRVTPEGEEPSLACATITFRVDDTERDELVARAAREKVNLSDYIRVRLGLRGQGSQGDSDVEIDPQHERALRNRWSTTNGDCRPSRPTTPVGGSRHDGRSSPTAMDGRPRPGYTAGGISPGWAMTVATSRRRGARRRSCALHIEQRHEGNVHVSSRGGEFRAVAHPQRPGMCARVRALERDAGSPLDRPVDRVAGVRERTGESLEVGAKLVPAADLCRGIPSAQATAARDSRGFRPRS
jgi:hypothetical protein